jgi:hypothetical protein
MLNNPETMAIPTRLYKYLPSKFAKKLVDRGDLLFRNLSYFRRIEDIGRCDLLEGLHMDYPDNDITIKTTDGRVKWKGQAAFLNSINPNKIFVFCLSEALLPQLYTEFNADTCLEILDPGKFLQKCTTEISRQIRFSEYGLLHNRVEYYAPNRSVEHNVKDPYFIPFFKHEKYSHQQEYRLATATGGGFKLIQRIINKNFTFDDELAAGIDAHKHVYIGSINDIVKVHYA